MLKINTKSK